MWVSVAGIIITALLVIIAVSASVVSRVEDNRYDQDTQLIKMAKREPLEEFGRSLISCTLSEKLITGANFASTVTYFDQNYIMRTWTELVNVFKENGRMADKFKNKGYEDFTIKNIEVVQLPDRIVFRFQREFTKNSQTRLAKTESSLLVLYLK